MTDIDVLVVGAGPVGVLLASELALGGARVQIVDALAAPNETIKAGSINVASAELLGRRGLLEALRSAQADSVERMAADGEIPQRFVQMARRGMRAAHFAAIPLDADRADDDDPRLAGHLEAVDATFVPQAAVERVLTEHAHDLGVRIRRGVTATGLTQHADRVTVHTDAGAIEAGWVVGCDGGRSVVRRSTDVGFPGTDPEITGRQAVVDLHDDTGLRRGWNWTTRGVYSYGPTPGRVLTVEFDGPPADRDAPVTAEELQASLRRVTGTDVTVTGVRGAATRWTDNARQASSYRDRRVLLAGDAAHVHSPFSGQGLNLGLGDAMNLGWKLAAVVTGRSSEQLLDTYTTERHPIGEWVLEWTRAQIALMRPDPKVGALRAVATDLVNSTDGMTHMVAEISGVARRVPVAGTGTDPLIGRTATDLHTRDGRPLRDSFRRGRFVLAGPAALTEQARPWADRVECADVDAEHALLARPDGVVVWTDSDSDSDFDSDSVSDDGGTLSQALEAWVGSPSR